MNWVLIELPMDEMRYPHANFSAYIEAPFDALDGVGPDDWFPLPGVAWDQAVQADLGVEPLIAFPPVDGPLVATVNEEKKIFSLLVDVSSFSPTDTIRIGLYGYVQSYSLTGILTDGPFTGTPISSAYYGSIGRDLSGATYPMTPAEMGDFPEGILRVQPATNPFGYTRLVSSFPELTGHSFVYSNSDSDKVIGVGFEWNDVDHPDQWWGDPSLVSPNDDPQAFMISGPQATTTTYWAPGIIKKEHHEGMTIDYGSGGIATDVVQTPPPEGTTIGSIAYLKYDAYFVPVVKFNDDRTVPVNMALSDPILWTQQAEHDYPGGASLTWETDDYPTRPEFAQIGTATIPSLDDAVGDVLPYNHFGQPRIGTITIIGDSVTFDTSIPPVPPADGTPNGDGPIGDGTAPGRTDNPHLRVWTFSLDEHDFYVLRLGDFDEVIYDTYSEQWMDWNDFNSLTWRAHCGRNWIGAEALGNAYGSNIVAGDDTYGLLWFLDPEQPHDDDPLGTVTPSYFSRVTMGQVPVKGRENIPCYALWLTTDMGAPAYDGAAVTLWMSDDGGETWDSQGFIQVTPDEHRPELAWYSLGQIEAPGRLVKIFDDGAITRIDFLEMNDPDDQK